MVSVTGAACVAQGGYHLHGGTQVAAGARAFVRASGIDQQRGDVAGADRAQAVPNRELLKRPGDARAPPHPGRIDELDRTSVPLPRHNDRVAGDAGLGAGEHALFAEQGVHQGGFAHIGATEDCDAERRVVFLLVERARLRRLFGGLEGRFERLLEIAGDNDEFSLPVTQEELAGMVGVTPSTISQIESNLIYPSLPALFKMAQVLSVDAGFFFQKETARQEPSVFAGGGKAVRFPDLPKGSIKGQHLLPPDIPSSVEPFFLEIPAGKKLSGHFFVHKGEEFGFLFEGRLQVTIQNSVKQLSAGDVVYLTRHIPSQWKNTGKTAARMIWLKIL